jgi:hypothetical protein
MPLNITSHYITFPSYRTPLNVTSQYVTFPRYRTPLNVTSQYITFPRYRMPLNITSQYITFPSYCLTLNQFTFAHCCTAIQVRINIFRLSAFLLFSSSCCLTDVNGFNLYMSIYVCMYIYVCVGGCVCVSIN